MQVCILMGSPRKNGNTNALRLPFQDELEQLGHTVTTHWLYNLDIRPCTACRTCQRDWSGMSCAIRDDVPALAEEILHSDLLVLATPIYSWYCTPPMKALMDRAIYAGNKNYGREKGPALLAGVRAASIATCGYRPERGADLWEEGLKRWCRHGKLEYIGIFCRRDLGREVPFLDEARERDVRDFARALHLAVKVEQP